MYQKAREKKEGKEKAEVPSKRDRGDGISSSLSSRKKKKTPLLDANRSQRKRPPSSCVTLSSFSFVCSLCVCLLSSASTSWLLG